ncbi:SDR family NAD(P)-dependent oxidoreductase [Glutamicibacter mishrai]|uniref:SDR family NAD(P)-dependent oxidoreductase n=1 Tax=Glutamicibacter mishrai TaxID=1775880 RepID=UPI0009DB9923
MSHLRYGWTRHGCWLPGSCLTRWGGFAVRRWYCSTLTRRASLSATTPTPYESIYGPTRSFMYSFAQSLREELREHGVSVTALLPGATATEFHDRAGMQQTKFGDNSWKNDPELVAKLGVEALFSGRDHVIGGDRGTRWAALRNKFSSEESKAKRFAQDSKPDERE